MGGHFVRVLAQAAEDPDVRLDALDPLTGEERRRQLVDWNDTAAGFPDVALGALLREQARARPDVVALVQGPERIAYGELLERVEAVARGLIAAGVRPGERVGLLLERSAGQVVAMLGALTAGVAYVPVDPAAPADRAAFILDDAGIATLLVDDADAGAAARLRARGTRVLALAALEAEAPAGAALPEVDPSWPAYCLYTSGTTGRPKGVLVSHRSLARLVRNDRFPMAVGPGDVWTLLHAYTFDFSAWEMLACLANGGTLVVVPRDDVPDAARLLGVLRREGVTVLNQTPRAFAELVAAWERDPAPLDHLRYVLLGGERLDPRSLAPLMRRWPGVTFVNAYGLTETAVAATLRVLTPEDAADEASNIGGPLPESVAYLLDARGSGRLLPDGAVGELYAGGLCLATGYLGCPELNAERFVPDPFGEGRLFRTGDLARRCPDGSLEIVGRADAQVKLRGIRIEPGEIAACVREHPAVADAVVVLEGGAEPRLAAYVVPESAAPPAAELRGHLAAMLPEYMVPSVFRVVERIPLTSHGKLDERALQETGTPLETAEGRLPATPTARALAEIWAEFLDVPTIRADDSFIELGGHSLLAIRLLARISERMGVELPLRTVFKHPRLQDMADQIDRERGPAPDAGDGAPEDGCAAFPASGMQEHMWVAERLEPDAAAYQILLTCRVEGRLDPDRLERALARVVERHEVLRTRFAEREGALFQVVCPPWAPPLDRADLADLAREDRETALRARLSRAAAERTDPASGRPLRAGLVETGDHAQVLWLSVHHLVWDAGSVPAFLRELDACYADGALPPAPPQYRDFVARREEELRGGLAREGLEYWARQLEGAPASLPLPAPAAPEPHGVVPIPLAPGLAERLRRVPGPAGSSWFMSVAAALATLLHRWTGRGDVTYGCAIALRDDAGLAEVIGPCMNTVVLRSRGLEGRTVRGALEAVRDTVFDAFQYRDVPFEAVVRRLDPPRRAGRAPYADVMLNVVTLPPEWPSVGGIRLRDVRVEAASGADSKFPLTVTVYEQAGVLGGEMHFRGDRLSRAMVERMARAFAALLEQIPERAEEPWSALDPGVEAPAAPGGPLAPPRAQYRDFVRAQRALREGPAAGAPAAFWRHQLAGAPAFLPFPTPARPGPHGVVPIPLPRDLLPRLRRLQGEQDVSWLMIAAAAVAGVLHRWTGRDDVTFGCPTVNREEEWLREVLGPCLNMVVLRSQVEPGTTLGRLLADVRDTVLDAFEHRDAPLEAVIDELKPPRRAGSTPFIDVTLAPEIAGPPARLGGMELEAHRLGGGDAGYDAKFALTIGLLETDGRLEGTLSFRGDRFAAADAEQLAALLGRMLDRFPASLDRPLATVDLLDERERERLRAMERGAPAGPPSSVPAMLARRCAEHPHAHAVVSGRGVLTYGDLDARARELALRLRPHVRGAEPVVALVLGRGEELVVAMLAAWKAGCAFSPIDPGYPRARIEYIVRDLDACAVVAAGEELRGGLAALAPVVAAEPGGAPAAGELEDFLPDPDALAYVLYTSGTTGQPKGVPIRHRNLAHFVDWCIPEFGVTPADRASQVSSVSFDASMWEVWGALCAGASVWPYERPAVVATELADWLDRSAITLCFAPTVLAEALWGVGATLPRLRWLYFAGSALTRRPPPELLGRVCNTYGPTETTIIVSADRMDPEAGRPLNSIGRPITGAALYVLDPAGRRCPVGVPGEVCIGGAGVAPGYWRRPELTGERFLPAGTDGEPGPVYRTGDVGRWRADGALEFIGRGDRQLKIRGYRVEPGEIEARLLEDPRVAQALVRPVPGEVATLAAYLVPRPGAPRDARAVLERVGSVLPDFMVPSAVVWLDELPTSVAGKVDVDRLPLPTRADRVRQAALSEPATPLERRIAAVWASVLQVEAVGVHDNFFDLGGNSLSLARLHARLQEALGGEIPIQLLFAHPTVSALARAAEAGDFTGGRAAAAPDDDLARRAARGRAARESHRVPQRS
uniref:Non-ribosomal peptide synthetase n=1 Tax=uncultured bacterium AB_1383 TaxID=1630010 RepID=A0A0E3M1R1_9BACT|nr:non-ribosomal peptide synthetase [uncultured bacterium AB_1383]